MSKTPAGPKELALRALGEAHRKTRGARGLIPYAGKPTSEYEGAYGNKNPTADKGGRPPKGDKAIVRKPKGNRKSKGKYAP